MCGPEDTALLLRGSCAIIETDTTYHASFPALTGAAAKMSDMTEEIVMDSSLWTT
jgi:hypothetical protein